MPAVHAGNDRRHRQDRIRRGPCWKAPARLDDTDFRSRCHELFWDLFPKADARSRHMSLPGFRHLLSRTAPGR